MTTDLVLLNKRADGSFIADLQGLPYHVTPGDPLWPAAVEAADKMGKALKLEAEPEPPTAMQLLASYTAAIETHVDQVAAARGYSSGLSCASYTSSTIPEWKAEAEAFVSWRDTLWTTALALLNEARGSGDVPSLASVMGALPEIKWP